MKKFYSVKQHAHTSWRESSMETPWANDCRLLSQKGDFSQFYSQSLCTLCGYSFGHSLFFNDNISFGILTSSFGSAFLIFLDKPVSWDSSTRLGTSSRFLRSATERLPEGHFKISFLWFKHTLSNLYISSDNLTKSILALLLHDFSTRWTELAKDADLFKVIQIQQSSFSMQVHKRYFAIATIHFGMIPAYGSTIFPSGGV